MARRTASEIDPNRLAQSGSLGTLLGDARRYAGLSQQSLAHSAGVSIGSVAKIEAGRSPEPGFFLVARLAAALSTRLPGKVKQEFTDSLYRYFEAAR
uniref:helix-turn-helix domain-containing protein n=1 Tax=Microbacterium sp. LWO13-1.2 TaxID=3135262 RepID=UPI00406C9FB2